jgi:hypothetical protein
MLLPWVIPNGLGELISGLGTIVGGIVALVGLSQWKGQRRAERQAEIAGKALVAVAELIAIMRKLEREEYYVPPQLGFVDYHERYGHWQKLLWDKDQRARYDSARRDVEAYLPEAAGLALGALAELRDEVDDALEWAAELTDRDGMPAVDSNRVLEGSWGDDLKKRLDACNKRIRDNLGPYAWLET